MMNKVCPYCILDTAGNHEWDCPLHSRHQQPLGDKVETDWQDSPQVNVKVKTEVGLADASLDDFIVHQIKNQCNDYYDILETLECLEQHYATHIAAKLLAELLGKKYSTLQTGVLSQLFKDLEDEPTDE